MKKSLNVAVFGLNFNILEQLKDQVLQAMPLDAVVNWVNLAEPKIDLLLVNDAFSDAVIIQKVIQNQNSAYLRLIRDTERAGDIEADILHYPLQKYNQFSRWLQQRFFSGSTTIAAPAPALAATMNAVKERDPEYVIKQLLTERNGYVQLFDQAGLIGLVDCRTERIWRAAHIYPIAISSQLNYSYATHLFVTEMTKNHMAEDLRTWLWQTFASFEVEFSSIAKNSSFKLMLWPRFEAGPKRRDFMKMAACFAEGARVKDVATTLELSEKTVIHFVQMAELLQFGEFIDEKDIQFHPQNNAESKSTTQNILSFFGKLRKKIGL